MWQKIKRYWREFRKGRPGHRFQERYERHQRTQDRQPLLWRFLGPCAGIVLILAGIAFCFIPGPGVPLLIVGAGLLANEWRFMARALDWLEVRVRKAIRWGEEQWVHAPAIGKAAIVLVAASAAAGAAYGTYHLLLER